VWDLHFAPGVLRRQEVNRAKPSHSWPCRGSGLSLPH